MSHSLERRWNAIRPAAPWLLAGAVAILYVVTLCRCSAMMFQDYPNHLARATILADLWFHHGARFGQVFEVHTVPYPYIGADLLLAPLVEWLGGQGATYVSTALAVLSLPFAMLFYLRATAAPPGSRVLIFLIALYLSTDAFFFFGFLNFRLSIPLTVLAMALAQILRRRLSPALFGTYCLIVAVGYLMHLAFLLFAIVGIGVTGLYRLWRRATSLVREAVLFVPLVLAASWYVISRRIYPFTQEVIPTRFVRAGLRTKLQQLDWPFVRFNTSFDLLFVAAFAVLLFWAARRRIGQRDVLQNSTWEPALLVVAFGMLYLVLPIALGDPSHIDVRAIPALPIFAAVWCASLPAGPKPGTELDSPVAIGGAAVLLIGYLAYLCLHLGPDRTWLENYRRLLSAVPRSSWVLPVYTREFSVSGRPNLDANAFLIMDRNALEPYLFSGDHGQPMKYFRYRHHPYAPDKLWYVASPPKPVDWGAIACTYDDLLVMKPYDPARIPIPTRTLAENSSAIILTPLPSACRGQ